VKRLRADRVRVQYEHEEDMARRDRENRELQEKLWRAQGFR